MADKDKDREKDREKEEKKSSAWRSRTQRVRLCRFPVVLKKKKEKRL